MATTSSLLSRGLGLVLVEFQYEYRDRDGTMVSIKPNERYVLLAKTNDHWWQVRGDHSSKPFYIPAKYVKELPTNLPLPLDFADPPNSESVLLPVVAPVPVPVPIPVPVPKTLEEPSGTRTKAGDEVTIRLKPDGYRKTENRMSTFGMPLDFHDLSHLVLPTPRHPGNAPAFSTVPGTTTICRTTNMPDGDLSKKQPHLPGNLDNNKEPGKPQLPIFSPSHPLFMPRPKTQPIPIGTSVVPVVTAPIAPVAPVAPAVSAPPIVPATLATQVVSAVPAAPVTPAIFVGPPAPAIPVVPPNTAAPIAPPASVGPAAPAVPLIPPNQMAHVATAASVGPVVPAVPLVSPNPAAPLAPNVNVAPVVCDLNDVHNTSLVSEGGHENNKPLVEPEKEEEELLEEEINIESSEEEEDSLKDEDSNHIYESIQDLNLDLDALIGGRGAQPAPDEPPKKNHSSPGLNAAIYANVSSLKKSSLPQISLSSPISPPPPPSEPAPPPPLHTPSSSVSSSSMISLASPVSPQDGWQAHTDQDSGKVFYYHPGTKQTTWSDPRSPRPSGDPDQSRGREGSHLTSTSSLLSPASSQGSSDWEQLVDEVSGRFYYHNRTTRTTSWTAPESPSFNTKQDHSPPPLPEEDYPVTGTFDNDAVFTTHPQQQVGSIPRAQLDLREGTRRLQEVPHLSQTMLGNGVSEEEPAVQAKNWRNSMAVDTFVPGHRRNNSDLTEVNNRRQSPDSPQLSDRQKLKRNLSNRSTGSHQTHGHLLEKAGIINKTKVTDHGKKIRKNWGQSWTVLHGGILTFHRDPKFAPTGNAIKSSQIVPEYTVELKGAAVSWASKEKSSKKNVLELKTRQGCEYLMQYDTESVIGDWHRVIQDAIRQLEHDHLTEDEDEDAVEKEAKEKKRIPNANSSSTADSDQKQVRTKLRRFLQRRPTLQNVKDKGYIRDNVFGCHLDTLCHRESSTVPRFVERCIRTVERRGLDVDGIYRVSGNLAVIQKLRYKVDREEQLDLEDGQWEEIHVITGALKLFLRELPEPLFPFSCFEKFIAAIQVSDYNLRVSYMKDLVCSLPLPNHDTMEVLFKHLRRVIEHKDSNRMSFQSMAIVFGPTLLRPETESANMTIHMVFQSQIVELMLKEFQSIFSQK